MHLVDIWRAKTVPPPPPNKKQAAERLAKTTCRNKHAKSLVLGALKTTVILTRLGQYKLHPSTALGFSRDPVFLDDAVLHLAELVLISQRLVSF